MKKSSAKDKIKNDRQEMMTTLDLSSANSSF
jgi:hypothetical protein